MDCDAGGFEYGGRDFVVDCRRIEAVAVLGGGVDVCVWRSGYGEGLWISMTGLVEICG